MGQVSYEQADLLLKLYDLRREAKLREARSWYLADFQANSPEELMQKYPPNSTQNAQMRMVIGYWEMACGFVNRGLIDDEMFFESNGEFWFVYEKIRPILPWTAGNVRQSHSVQTSGSGRWTSGTTLEPGRTGNGRVPPEAIGADARAGR